MRKAFSRLALLAAAGVAAAWMLSAPHPLPDDALAGLTPDAAHGAQVFWAAGCASCHAASGAKGNDKLKLGGGQRFISDFGTFIAPNISPDPQNGIGGWRALDLANAMQRGLSPDGAHLYPAFPYTAYANASAQDVVDLRAFLQTLPPVTTPSAPHEVGFPFNIRRGLGLWKRLFADKGFVLTGDLTPAQTRGRYLVEALGHCGECHTPRNALGGLQRGKWLSGAPNPDGKGRVPNITPGKLKWDEADIAYYLETGFTPEFDSVGGHMVSVVDNLGHLPASDRAAIAAYLKRVPPVK